MVQSLWPALTGPSFATAFEPIQNSIGIDRIPEPFRSQVLAIQDIRQETVLGYWDDLLRTDPDNMQAQIDDTASRIACPYLAVFGRKLAPQSAKTSSTEAPVSRSRNGPTAGTSSTWSTSTASRTGSAPSSIPAHRELRDASTRAAVIPAPRRTPDQRLNVNRMTDLLVAGSRDTTMQSSGT